MLYVVLCLTVLGLAYVFANYARIKKMEEGTADMAKMAGIIRDGAATFLKTEFKSIAIVCVILALIFQPWSKSKGNAADAVDTPVSTEAVAGETGTVESNSALGEADQAAAEAAGAVAALPWQEPPRCPAQEPKHS